MALWKKNFSSKLLLKNWDLEKGMPNKPMAETYDVPRNAWLKNKEKVVSFAGKKVYEP